MSILEVKTINSGEYEGTKYTLDTDKNQVVEVFTGDKSLGIPENVTHFNSETGSFGVVDGTPEETVIAEDAPPKPELLSFNKDDIVGRGTFKNIIGRTDQDSYLELSDGTIIRSDTGSALNTSEEVDQVNQRATDYVKKTNEGIQSDLDAWNSQYVTTTGGDSFFVPIELTKDKTVVDETVVDKTVVDKPVTEVIPEGGVEGTGSTLKTNIVPGTATDVTKKQIDASNKQIMVDTSAGTQPLQGVSVPVTQPTYYQQPVQTTQTFQPVPSQTGAATSTYGMSNVTGTQQTPLQTSGLSAVPKTIQARPNYTGTTMQNVSSISQQGFGGQRIYTNAFGQEITVSVDATGNPLTYKPPGFYLKGSPQDSAVQQQQQSGQTGGQNIQVMGAPQRGTGSTPYTGPMSSSVNVNPGIPQPSLSQLSTSQELIIGPDGWRVRNAGMYQGGMTGYALGGDVQGQLRLANKFLGYQGEATQDSLNAFLNSNPGAAAKMGKYEQAMRNMANPVQTMYQGGVVQGFSNGGSGPIVGTGITGGPSGDTQEADLSAVSTINSTAETAVQPEPDFYYDTARPMAQSAIQQTMQPIQAPVNYITPQPADFIGSTAGQTTAVAPMAEAATVGNVTQSQMPQVSAAGQMTDVKKAQTGVSTEVAKLSAQTGDTPDSITGQQQTTSAVTGLDAATQDIFKPATNQYTRALTQDPITGDFTELVSGSANAATAAKFTEQMQADTALPSTKATVAGQLDMLMRDFEGGDTPAWAAGSMRAATAAMLQRGLGASSMAGQAIIQATMESALPIAMADAQTQASFEAQNLSNRQAKSMLAAQQRAAFIGQEFDQAFQARVQNAAKISDIANQNFSADQTIQLENSRAAQTLSLTNLSNTQALVMSEAAALAGLDTQNLNNRQQAAVQNAQNFLQMDMANLTNQQQTAMFKTQQNVQALFTDQAAENASKQFNASSTNQTNQFFANLATQTAQFNAAQTNAMDQFNVNAVNGLREFNSNIQQQRDMFNAQNGLVIAQANAKWRQDLTTLNNATQNESNMSFAQTINGLTSKNIDAIWQRERDIMSNVNQSTESAKDRALQILVADKELASAKEALDYAEDVSNTQLLTRFLFPDLTDLFKSDTQ